MKILITGYKGFIGTNMVNALKNHTLSFYDWGDPKPNVKNLDWVIHLGAISSTTETNISKIIEQNITSSIELFEECVQHNVNFQWSSSASVYGKSYHFKEDLPTIPLNLYARSKFLLEQYITHRETTIIKQGFRYFNVYGPYEHHKGNQASPHTQFEIQAKETGVIKVFEGSENFKRDFIHVDEVIDIHQKFLYIKESGIWNVGTGNPTSFLEVAEQVARQYNCKIETIPFPEHLKQHYQYYTCANLNKLNYTLNKKVL